MIKFMITCLLVFSLSGCLEELDDGYQFGDLTRTVETYCDEHADDLLRQAALQRLNAERPYMSEEGICVYLEE